MIVCHCHGVTDRAIVAAVEKGASDPDALAQVSRAGSDCGGCIERIKAILDDLADSLARAS